MSRVVILGAGIAGLTAAFRRRWEAKESETLLLESGPKVGGSIQTVEEEGFVMETGPNTLRTTLGAERLLFDLNLEGEVVPADERAPRWIVRKGLPRAIVPGPPGLFTSAVSPLAKLRVLGEPFVAPRPGALDDESVHEFFERRFGPDLARYAAGPIVSGVYADDPRTLSVRSAFPALWEAEGRGGSVIRGFLKKKEIVGPKPPRHRARTLNFKGGLKTLPETLERSLRAMGAEILLSCAVAAVEGPLPASSSPHPWRVVTGDGRVLEADRLVSTLDARSLVRLLGDRLPRSAPRLSQIEYSRLVVVLQAFETPRPEDMPKGFGVLIPRGEGYKALGVLYPSSLFPGRIRAGVSQTTSFIGGALEPTLPDLSDEELKNLAEDEVRRLHPGIGRKIYAKVVRWPAAIPRLPLRHYETLALLEQDLAAVNGEGRKTLFVTGPWKDGVSLGDRIARGEELGSLL
jgi:oxygen-dependent protoporphyrinogen oxidase